MLEKKSASKQPAHSKSTTLFHMAIAVLIVVQLASSEFMHKPKGRQPGNWLFEIHEYAGLTAFCLALLFFSSIFYRSIGTKPGLLFPWFSCAHLRSLWQDTQNHSKALLSMKVPAHTPSSPVICAFHGAGLLLVLGMGLTGSMWYLTTNFLTGANVLGHYAKETHEALSTFIWAYIIVHASFGVLNQLLGRQKLAEMWSYKK